MNTLSKHLERRFLLARVVAEDPKELRRSNESSRREISCRTAHMTESLRLVQLGLPLQQPFDRDAKVPIVLPDPLFRLLCRGDIHHRTDELDVARLLVHGMSCNPQMLDGAIRHQQSMLEIKILPIPRHARDRLFHQGRILRMNPLENALHGRFRRSVVLEDSKGFLRPEDLAARNAPAESPRATEALGLRQAGFAAPQRFRLLACISDQTDPAE